MVRSLPSIAEDKCEAAGLAAVEHHFDNHKHCGAWCQWKKMSAEEMKAKELHYRCKKKDASLHEQLNEIMACFLTFERLKELAHGMDTNANESINDTIAHFAPKNRVFCTARSLQNQVAFAVGITSLAFNLFFQRPFTMLGIDVPTNVLHCLQVKCNNRSK